MINNDKSKTSALATDIVFEYKGKIYNRPLGRGIALKDGEYGERGMYLDEVIPDGDFEIEIIIRKSRV